MDRRGNNAMRLIKTEEEKNLEKIYAPYHDQKKHRFIGAKAVNLVYSLVPLSFLVSKKHAF